MTSEPPHRGPLQLGSATLDPSSRYLSGAGGNVRVEPKIAQVLVRLASPVGALVTRAQLLDDCWAGRIVGDDALHRCIAVLRRLARTSAANSFTIETIPKAGYRLIVHALDASDARDIDAAARTPVSALNGAAEPPIAQLLREARQAMRAGLPDRDHQGIGFLNEAIARAPANAEAWGLSALAWCNAAEHSAPEHISAAVENCERAADRALNLQPDQPEALAALAILPPIFGDWQNADRRLDAALRVHPNLAPLLAHRGLLLQSVGRCRDAVAATRHAARAEPLSPVLQYRLAYQLAACGEIVESDMVIDRATQLWPTHPAVWYARFLLFATTDRIAPALQQLRESAGAAYGFQPTIAKVWATVLTAVATRSPADVELATSYCGRMARANTAGAVNALLGLCLLRALDEAFEVADGTLLRRGPLVGPLRTADTPPSNEQRWRKTMMLWIPAASAMRRDARFGRLVHDIGMAEYWRWARAGPDDPHVLSNGGVS